MELRRLEERDDRRTFSCGEAQLDEYFRSRAGQSQFKYRASTTYVLIENDLIVGFVTVVPGTMRRDDFSAVFRRFPPSPLPVLILARMGISLNRQRQGLGERLVGKVLELALSMARDVGCVGILVDAKMSARGFYERYDFQWLPDQPQPDAVRGFLPIRTIEPARAEPTTAA